MGRLTEAQRRVLSYLARRKDYDGPPTGPEVGAALGFKRRTTGSDYLFGLAKKGLVERLGWGFDGGRCWRITDLGRAALAREPERREG